MRTPTKHTLRDGSTVWRVKFRYRNRDGHDSTSSQTFPTKREAERFAALVANLGASRALDEIMAEQNMARGITLDDLAEAAFEQAAKRHRSDRTVHDYRRDYRNWIGPTLGRKPAAAVTEADVQNLVDSWHGKLSPKSIADRHAILHGIYDYGVAASRRLVPHNPCIGTELPKRTKKPPKGLRPAEWQALHTALEQIDQDAADLALFLLATGWRFSEAAALQAFDVEDDGWTVYVNMGRVLRRNANNQYEFVEDEGKSAAALRRIRLDDDVANMVRQRLSRNIYGTALVLTTSRGNQWRSSNFNNRYWKPAVKAAGLEARHPTPHWLRHTSVAWLIMSKQVSLPEIQRRIGHEHISTTVDVYGRLVDDVSSEALEAFARIRQSQLGAAQPRIEG